MTILNALILRADNYSSGGEALLVGCVVGLATVVIIMIFGFIKEKVISSFQEKKEIHRSDDRDDRIESD
jgi:hypothetical protein